MAAGCGSIGGRLVFISINLAGACAFSTFKKVNFLLLRAN
jgi:hypothetical protein